MLQGINRVGQSWVGKSVVAVLFGLLIASFAVWGIGDVFRGTVRTQVATVGGQDITADAYRNAYQAEYQALVRQAGRSVTPEQARALGLEDRVLNRLIAEAVLDQDARRYGLAVTDALVIQAIQADPAFRGPAGTFDRGVFSDTLRQNGFTEAQYVRERRIAMAREQLAEGFTGGLRIPLAMREAVHRFQAERRSAEFATLGAASLGEIAAPTEEQIKTFYDERKTSFRAPEYRAANIMTLSAAALAKPDSVSDEDARAFYARVKDEKFGRPERRAVQQIIFPTRAEAEAASARIKAGTSFEAIAAERGVDDATLNLGTVVRGDLLDEAVADAAFSLPEGGVSAPIDGRFGTVLVRVPTIEPGTLKPFEEVAPEVKREIATERARAEVVAVHDAIEDARAGAKPLAEIARERGLPLVSVPALDRSGLDKDGKPVPDVAGQRALVTAIFRSEPGQDSEAVPTADGGYIWFDVTGIEAARDRPLADIRDQVAAEWRSAEVARLLSDKARALVERLDKGEPFAAVAASAGLKPESATEIARGQPKDGLPAPAVTRLFATPVGKAGSAPSGDDARTVFKVTAATVPPFMVTTQEAAGAETQLRTLLLDDLLAEYLADAQKRVGVTVYRSNVRRAIGGES